MAQTYENGEKGYNCNESHCAECAVVEESDNGVKKIMNWMMTRVHAGDGVKNPRAAIRHKTARVGICSNV